jgi:predicted PhzF superfamily epimerase YddE/YHI9
VWYDPPHERGTGGWGINSSASGPQACSLSARLSARPPQAARSGILFPAPGNFFVGGPDGEVEARAVEALARAAINAADFADRLAAVGAQFAYLLDPDGLEGRHWTNDGRTEDVATGSAAGTVGAYLARAGRAVLNQPFTLHQGRFTGRPSQIQVEPRGSAGEIARILVGGQVALVAKGRLRSLPGAFR